MRISFLILASVLLLAVVTRAQAPPPWKDAFVDHLAGTWRVEGTLVGQNAHHTLSAEWVLNHEFLRMEEKTSADAPKGESAYDALWFLGYDEVSERYVLHLIDIFGGRYSETLGYGTRSGNEIRFTFEYPDGPFHNTMRWDPAKDTWEWLLEQKDKNGKWAPFADLHFTRPANP
jgi:Protein of unknown function (DUF1579)